MLPLADVDPSSFDFQINDIPDNSIGTIITYDDKAKKLYNKAIPLVSR